MICRVNFRISLLFKHFTLLDSRLHLYKVFVRPLLKYCPIFYSFTTKAERLSIERLQRRFTKRLLGTSCNLTYPERCDQLKLQPLWFRRLQLNLIIFFKLLRSLSFTNSTLLSMPNTSVYNTRQHNLHVHISLPGNRSKATLLPLRLR